MFQWFQVMFPINVPASISTEFAGEYLARQGYKRIARRADDTMLVVQDRLRPIRRNRSRLIEAVEHSLKQSKSTVVVQELDENRQATGSAKSYSSKLRCADCNIDYSVPVPNLFSFNSPIGACETCRGFGKLMDIDYSLVIPDESLSLREGAIKPFTSKVYSESWRDILQHAPEKGVPLDIPWKRLSRKHKAWVMDGEGSLYSGRWLRCKAIFQLA